MSFVGRLLSVFCAVALLQNATSSGLIAAFDSMSPPKADLASAERLRMASLPAMKAEQGVPLDQLANAVPTIPQNQARVVTLLDEVGRITKSISKAEAEAWKVQLRKGTLSGQASLEVDLRIGEYELGAIEEPEHALVRFERVARRSSPQSPLHGLARYNAAAAKFYRGRYKEASDEFRSLIQSKLIGFDRKNAAIWSRHADACYGYHKANGDLGITQPRELDPLCGASSLAVCLKQLGLLHSKEHVIPKVHHTGMGSTMKDLVEAAEKLGVAGHAIQLNKKGLIDIPKPLVAHVERDHFISVTKADSSGVTYFCSDCGPWPGGTRTLTWKQWKAMDADFYLSVSKKSSATDQALIALRASQSGELAFAGPASSLIPLAQIKGSVGVQEVQKLISLLSANVVAFFTIPLSDIWCGSKPESQHCPPCISVCPMDSSGSGSQFGPSAGDPVNLATGEEEYRPAPDLAVYNPIGPSVSFSRLHNTLRNCWAGFGLSWSHTYFVGVVDPNIDEELEFPPHDPRDPREGLAQGLGGPTDPPLPLPALPRYVLMDNGARVQFTPVSSTAPTALTPQVACTVLPGYPVKVTWDYNSTSGGTFYTVTWKDRSKWVTKDRADTQFVPVKQMIDRMGNWISLDWLEYREPYMGYVNWPMKRLTQISDSAGQPLLTMGLDAAKNYVSATDRYNRSVYYHCGRYSNSNVPLVYQQYHDELDQVSQVVPTGTSSPPLRYTYGYQVNQFGHPGAEMTPFLRTITVPSPTGSGTATTTINYDNSGFVTSIVDGNGNTREYLPTSASETKVTVKNSSGTVVFRYYAVFGPNMGVVRYKNASGQTTLLASYSDPNNPLQPSSFTDGNSRTWQYSWDQFGNMLTATSPKNTITTFTLSYSNSPLGEVTRIKEGAKTGTDYAYYQPSGLLQTVSAPIPGEVGTNNTQVTTFTYDGLGNLISMVEPGNNSAATKTTTLNYTTDGAYSTTAKVSQPLMVTDPLGKVWHFRYDARGNTTDHWDPLGNLTTASYNIANQLIEAVSPNTGNSGSGISKGQYIYQYPDGQLQQVKSYDESGVLFRTITSTYGQEGELLSQSGAQESLTRTYDGSYRVKTQGDGNGNVTTNTYDLDGHLTKVAYPGATGLSYDQTSFTSYDLAGNLLQRVDGSGVVTNYAYSDTDGKISNVSYPATPGLNLTFSYDGFGRRTGGTDPTGSVSCSFDDLDNKVSATRTYTGLAGRTFDYTFYPDGSRATMTNPAGTWNYYYDSSGRPTSMGSPAGTVAYQYQDNGLLTRRTLPNGTTTDVTYNEIGLPKFVHNKTSGGVTLSKYEDFLYDGVFNRLNLLSTIPGATSQAGQTSWQFDAKDRLTQEQSQRFGGYTQQFAYDTSGNPTTWKGSSRTYNSNNQLTGSGYAYDGNGNATTYAGAGLTFDVENRLTGIGSSWSASYRDDGLRAWKDGGSRTYFLYDDGFPVIEMNSAGTVTATNVYSPDGLVGRKVGSTWTYYTFDPQGNIAQRLDSSQSIVDSSCYDAYGVESSTSTPADPFGFNARWGYYLDRETGLYSCQLRYYDAAAGRWLTRDPAQYWSGPNVYAYCAGSPINRVDPSGLQLDSVSRFCSRYPTFCVELSREMGWAGAGAGAAGAGMRELTDGDNDEAMLINGASNFISQCMTNWGPRSMMEFGKAAHNVLSRGSAQNGYQANQTLANGSGRPDLANWGTRLGTEFKPSTWGGLQKGVEQAAGYEAKNPGWNIDVIPYPVPWNPSGWPFCPPELFRGTWP